ncbi:hypothetical protein GOPIP_010_00740 [Gordonia polyisoprenivorans NBRC 16320 = JCM 10675]|uniref:Toll/interleukin-1 receptor domain-containing protein n=1 Tax=Gordonia polyisoprenivorans TaxID=84595 RepID=A0A846WSH5_9ACTN|nr:toll/interleukin-1 receptor domain-containing protein [Gordonia polyisoprenivorans]NKY04564.1 toll/interleukin-1 receptor domain-containing protein [Gordonia polyisoprenivorans]GAB21607.1 hypothetical protein GOPIP_010_00740 [Gordonia polyisoprenivorans NBRC 16320 = JCM 10675]
MDKQGRVKLVLAIAHKIDDRDELPWDHANIILRTYGVAELDDDSWGPTTAETIDTATDEQLLELAQHFGLELPSEAPAAVVTAIATSTQPLFMFASHLAMHRVLVHEVAEALAAFGIKLFVAHDSITVDTEWHSEIESALDRADAGLVFLHRGFKESSWCDQEVGWLLGRHVPVMALRFDADPYGPLGKHQAQTAGNLPPEAIASSTLGRIASKPELQRGFGASLVDAMAASPRFAVTDSIWLYLRELRSLDSSQCARLLQACKDNTQINWANSALDGGTPYPRAIVAFLRQQPGGGVITADIDAYEVYLQQLEDERNVRSRGVASPPPTANAGSPWP